MSPNKVSPGVLKKRLLVKSLQNWNRCVRTVSAGKLNLSREFIIVTNTDAPAVTIINAFESGALSGRKKKKD